MAKRKKSGRKKAVKPAKSGKQAARKVVAAKKASSKAPFPAGTNPQRVTAILAKLDEAYPNATCELKHDNAFQLLISTILPRSAPM